MILLISDNYASQAAGLEVLVKDGVRDDEIDMALGKDLQIRDFDPDVVAFVATTRDALESRDNASWIDLVNRHAAWVVTLVLAAPADSVMTTDPAMAMAAIKHFTRR